MRIGSKLAVMACLLALWGGVAGATSLNLTTRNPDIYSGFILVEYEVSGGVGTFTATGSATNLSLGGLPDPDYSIHQGGNPLIPGTFSISMQVDPYTGEPVPGTGTLTITGEIPDLACDSGTLLTGTLSQFGYAYQATGASVFEFIFTVGDGDLATRFGPKAGVILTADVFLDPATQTERAGGFLSAYSNELYYGFGLGFGLGSSDTFTMVPEPMTLAGLLVGIGGVAGYLRRRRAGEAPAGL